MFCLQHITNSTEKKCVFGGFRNVLTCQDSKILIKL